MSLSLAAQLEDLKSKSLYRSIKEVESAPEAHVQIGGRRYINFSSNNYLGLATDEKVKAAAAAAAQKWGAGATASRLMGGSLEPHRQLEEAMARFKRTRACAVFPSGYHVNLGLIPALAGPGDTIILDRLCHASMVDGARLSRAALKVFRHNDPADLERILKRRAGPGAVWILTESVFSMDGDRAPLSEIAAAAGRHGAKVYVDEAHATGVLGDGGRGLVNALNLQDKIDVCMGTFSKALGSQGGFACGSAALIDWVRNKCRSFIYSTALAPASAAAALAALDIAQSAAGEKRRKKLESLSRRLLAGIGQQSEEYLSPIIPFLVGDEARAVALTKKLWDSGVFAPAVRFPTVAKGAARIRFSLTALHEEEDVDHALNVL